MSSLLPRELDRKSLVSYVPLKPVPNFNRNGAVIKTVGDIFIVGVGIDLACRTVNVCIGNVPNIRSNVYCSEKDKKKKIPNQGQIAAR